MDKDKLIADILRRLQQLEGKNSKNTFSSMEYIRRYAIFTNRLRIPHFAAAPTNGYLGEIIEVGGKLMICASLTSGTFVVAGTQS